MPNEEQVLSCDILNGQQFVVYKSPRLTLQSAVYKGNKKYFKILSFYLLKEMSYKLFKSWCHTKLYLRLVTWEKKTYNHRKLSQIEVKNKKTSNYNLPLSML